jgi:hypothetical protein
MTTPSANRGPALRRGAHLALGVLGRGQAQGRGQHLAVERPQVAVQAPAALQQRGQVQR